MTREQIAAAAEIVRESISTIDYARLIGLPVTRAGFTRCPFHSGDHDASLKLYDGQRGFHCFGCHASGDVIELAKRIYNLKYPQAIVQVAQDAGIQLPSQNFYHSHATQQALHRARISREQSERTNTISQRIEDAYWKAFDRWLELDRRVLDLADIERDRVEQGFSDEFAQALMSRQQAKLALDYLAVWRA